MSVLLEIFSVFLRLGFTSFGGPVAHLGYFHQEFVVKKKWITDQVYAELVALCQFLPGPASSQVGMAIGFSRGGLVGAILAWLGFTLPSFFILVLFGLGISSFASDPNVWWIHSLKIVAVSVVAHAVYNMAKKLCPDLARKLMALASALVVLLLPSAYIQLVVMAAAALMGVFLLKSNSKTQDKAHHFKCFPKQSLLFLSFFAIIAISLPLLREIYPQQWIKLADSFYRAGTLVFGGGHVVLPLIQSEVVSPGWVSKDLFMAGYGLAQAIPGPLFAFSAFLGAVSHPSPNGWAGASLCLLAAFLPAFLLIIGALPLWDKLTSSKKAMSAVMGINASVVGLLLSAFCTPVWTSAIFNIQDFLLASGAFLLLEFRRMSSWLVVILVVFTSYLLKYFA